MKLSLIFELLMIFVLLAFAASKNINKHKSNTKGLRTKEDDNIKIEDNSLNRYCKCSDSLCNCCRDFSVPVVNLNGPGCASLMYLNGDKMSISLSFGKKVITNRTVASRKPSPVCMPLPGGISKFCGRVYNIAKAGDDFRACLGLELQAKSTVEAAVRVSCFKFGPRGVISEPADPLPLVPQEETETEDDDDDDEEEDDFGLDADEDDDDGDEDDEDDDDDEGEIDAVNDVDSADYTGFSLLGEDLLGGLFGTSGGKKPNKNRNKQAQISSSSTTTRRPRPNRRTTRRPNTRTTPKPITRTTTVKVRPINRRPTRRPSRRPTRRPTTSSAESFPISNISEVPSDTISASTESQQIVYSTNVQMQNLPGSSENIQSNQKIVSGNEKLGSMSATTPVTATSFEDSGLEMSLAHITGQLSVMPATQIIPTLAKDSETKSSEEQISYEKVQTITPKPHSTVPFATVVDDDEGNEETVQIVQSLDSHSEEQESDKTVTVDESRAHSNGNHYEGLVMPKKKHRSEQFELEDLDVLDLTKIGESVGHQLGIFGRHKRQNQNKDNKHKKHRNGNADYDIVSGLDAINESLGLPDIEVARRRSNRRQNKMMRDWSKK